MAAAGKSRLLVVGATGSLGGVIARMLLARGHRVRVLVRRGSDTSGLAAAGAELVLGDLKDRGSIAAACSDVDAILTTANSALRGGDDNPQTVDLEGNSNLVDIAKTTGVRQLVFVSALGAAPSSPIPFMAAKGKTEEKLIASGVPYTILAPSAFMDFWIAVYIGAPAITGSPVTIAGEGNRKHSFIAGTDVASFAVASLGNAAAVDRKLVLGGPSPVSLLDAVAAYERALGRNIAVHHVRPGDPVPGLPPFTWALAGSLDTFDSPVDMSETAPRLGVPLTSIDEFVRQAVQTAK